jgi:hypothetical protein
MKIGDLIEYTFCGTESTGVVLDMSPSGWTVTVLWDDGDIEPIDVEGATVINESR